MRAAVLRGGGVHVRDEVEEPVPGPGQVLVEVAACGICGSDLHFARHGAEAQALGARMEGVPRPSRGLDLGQDVYLGHEFACRILEPGPDTEAPPAGTLVTALPFLPHPGGETETIVYSNSTKGGLGERMVLAAPMLLAVPNGLPAHLAALTEPMSVGLHAVVRSGIEADGRAVVVGCGPVGLAVVAALAQRGVRTIVAADFSPARRALAAGLGATEVVDPRVDSPWSRVPRGRVTAFEAVGVPGVLDEILRCAPWRSRVVVVGVCMGADTWHPYFGLNKELSLDFAIGYSPDEFGATLHAIAEGLIDVAPLVTARIGLDELPWAFAALRNPEEHCKIIVEP
jgi:threonine dehydrogenase-like Zn-dependent dehydrogenase